MQQQRMNILRNKWNDFMEEKNWKIRLVEKLANTRTGKKVSTWVDKCDETKIGKAKLVLATILALIPLIYGPIWIIGFAFDAVVYVIMENNTADNDSPRYTDSWGIEYIKTDGYATLVDGKKQSGKMILPDVVNMSGEAHKIKVIGRKAFEGSGLTSVRLQKHLYTIDNFAFEDCKHLTSIIIPPSVRYIGYSAFDGCDKLTKLIIQDDDGLLYIDGKGEVIYNSPFYDGAFKECPLETLYLGRDFEYKYGKNNSTSHDSFSGIKTLKTVILGRKFKVIGKDAFDGCDALTSIYCMSFEPYGIDWFAFDRHHYDDVTVYVPQGSLAAYRQSYDWADFKNMKEYDMAVVIPQLLAED